ncbi:autotransporter outer membrane beta-barrel domain-containing protein [Phenylobacterium sp.]|jgi:outer membrane autotransporter protein|uniref:autotransporter outer membrane beta-barrel domain-containing protein n=1 Tax=Phenylobacterium sp. TaxID=1871053 RepID=UPI002E35AB3B|nr:autotransporter outer membrane beta-barrel domain-containing protein [Phenylobacterium sp.]HEX2562072.1 autotransporter outer membrane beta-barrel domain-containing protein [Phenylobacterium sp.]
MRFLISAVAGLLAAAALFALPAAAQTAGTVVQPDGTTIQTTINGLNDIRIVLTGGPQFTNNPATVQFTSVSPAASGITYVGTITQGGQTHPFTCVLDTATQQVTGSGACAQAFGQPGASTPGTVVNPPTTPTTPTTPTVTTTPEGTTVTGTGGDGTVVTVTFGEQAILGLAEADQLTGALTADRMTVSGMQSFVNARAQGIWLANLASIRAASGLTDAGYRGRSAGQGGGGGIWFNATGAWLEDERTGVAKDGQTGAFAFGADHVGDALILGGFLGYAATDLEGPGVHYEANGWSGGAYLSWSPAATVQLTGLVGYGQHDIEHDRAFAGLRSVGETERDQLYGAFTLQTQWALGERWVLVPSLGISASASDTDGYRDGAGRLIPGVETDLTTASVGAAAYWRGERVLPFVAVTLNEELDGPASQDSSYALVGAGFEAAVADRLSVALSVQTLIGKSGERETSVGLTLRRGF